MITLATRSLREFGGTELWTLTLAKYLSKHEETQIYCRDVGESGLYSTTEITREFKGSVIANHPTVTNPPQDATIVTHSTFLEVERLQKGYKNYISVSNELREIELKRGFSSTIILNPIDTSVYKPVNKPSKTLKKVLYVGWTDRVADVLKVICESNGLEFNRLTERKPDLSKEMQKSDLCIGIGRHLIEAMLCGKPVISVDYRHWMDGWLGAGYVKPENFYMHQLDNYSGRTNPEITNAGQILQHIQQYNHEDGERLAQLAKIDHDANVIAQKFLTLYG